MKSFIRILAVLLLFSSCRTLPLKTTLFPDIPAEHLLPGSQESSRTIFRTERIPIGPEHIIDDFEAGTGLWSIRATAGSSGSLAEIPSLRSGGSRAMQISFQLPRRRFRGLHADEVQISLFKDTPFEKYTGLQFTARSADRIPLRVVLFEHNQVAKNVTAREFWVREVDLSPEWRVYRIFFREFAPEEYYEQAFIGNDRMELDRVRELGFCVRNIRLLDRESGSFDIDDVQLF